MVALCYRVYAKLSALEVNALLSSTWNFCADDFFKEKNDISMKFMAFRQLCANLNANLQSKPSALNELLLTLPWRPNLF